LWILNDFYSYVAFAGPQWYKKYLPKNNVHVYVLETVVPNIRNAIYILLNYTNPKNFQLAFLQYHAKKINVK